MEQHLRSRGWMALLMCLCTSLWIGAQPAGFSDQIYLNGFTQAVGLTFDANGRMYVWEKAGKVWVVENGVKRATPLIDISEEVGDWRDFGMVGFALDPNFLTNGHIYLWYVVDRHHLLYFGTPSYNPATNEYFNATIGRLTRYTATAASNFTQVDYNSRRVLIGESKSTGAPILHESHGVGQIAFGTDGTLLVSMGDGASYSSTDQGSATETYYNQALADGIITAAENVGAYRSQQLFSQNGKIMRVDPATGNGLSSNPFFEAGNPRSNRSRVWSYGLRNPYRFVQKPNTGSHNAAEGNPGIFYAGDVGWGSREELDVITQGGQNFGWPKYEGMTTQPGYNNTAFTPAVHELPRVDWRTGTARGLINGVIYNVGSAQLPGTSFTGNASTGGVWYTGTDFPATYRNTYFHADYGGGWIRNFSFDANHNPTEVRDFISNGGPIVYIATHPQQGNLYYVKYPSEIHRVTYNGSNNQAPIAIASADKTYGPGPLTVQFTGDQSMDPDGSNLTFEWNFGDGATSTAVNPSHTFSSSGLSSYNVQLTVRDGGGLSAVTQLIISTNNTPPVIQSTSLDNLTTFSVSSNTNLNLSAVVTDAEHSSGQLSYSWVAALHHNDHNHPEAPITTPTGSTLLTPVGCDGATYWYRITLTVTDPAGLKATYVKDLFPACPGANQTVAFASIPDKVTTDQPFNLSATASSGLPVSYYVTKGPAQVIGNTVILAETPGEVTVIAAQHGNGTFAPAVPVSRTFQVRYTGNNTPGGSGLTGNYFNNMDFTAPVLQRVDPVVDFDWGTGSPDPAIGAETFSVRWEGEIQTRFSELYTFYVTTDDGMRLWVNNQLIIDRFVDQAPTTHSATITLTAGQRVPIRIDYYENGGGAVARLEWSSATQARQVVPQAYLFPASAGPQNQTITFAPIADKQTTDAPFAVNATASSGLPVAFTVVSGPATITGNTVTLTGNTGTVTIRASQGGNAQYNPAPTVDQSFQVTSCSGNSLINRSGWSIRYADSEELQGEDGKASNAIDGNTATIWHTQWQAANPVHPHEIQIDLGATYNVSGFRYLPRQDATFNGTIANYECYVSTDGSNWGTAVAGGTLAATKTEKEITFPVKSGRYLRLRALSEVNGNPWTSAAEINVLQGCTSVAKQDQTINFPAIADKLATDAPFALNATASSGLPVSYAVISGPATVSGSTVTLTGSAGTVTIRASQSGDTQYNPAPSVDRSFAVTAPPTGNGTGLTGNYFNNMDFTAAALQRVDPVIDFNWGTGSPDPSMGVETFSVRWEGDIQANYSEVYTFYITTDDGMRLWVNNQLIIDRFIDQAPTTHSATIALTAGQKVPIRLDYYENGGGAVARLEWSSARQVRQVVPQLNLYPAALKQSQTISFAAIADKLNTDAPFALSASASSGLPVSYAVVSGPATVSGNTVTLTGGTGTVTIRASQAGNAQYNPAPDVNRSFAVTAINTGPCFAEANGLLVVEAEHFTTNNPGTGSAAARSWQLYSDGNASGGQAMRTTGTGVSTGENINGPRLDYDVEFNTTGTYYIWVRMIGPNGSDNSVHVGLDNVPATLGYQGLSLTSSSWRWANRVGTRLVTVNITTPGRRTLNVWMREDGTRIDKIVMTRSSSYVPGGTGPAESGPCGSTAGRAAALTLSATPSGWKVDLAWISEAPQPEEWFLLERSADGVHFEPLDQIPGSAGGGAWADYFRADPTPLSGWNHYRVTRVQADGQLTISGVAAVYLDQLDGPIALFPNPVKDYLTVDLRPYAGQEVRLLMSNNAGQMLEDRQLQAAPDQPLEWDMSRYRNGWYTLYIQVKGRLPVAAKVVVAKD